MSELEITLRANFQRVPPDYLPVQRRQRPIYGLRWWVNVPTRTEECDWRIDWLSVPVLTVPGYVPLQIPLNADPIDHVHFHEWCGHAQFSAFRDWVCENYESRSHVLNVWKWSPLNSCAERLCLAAAEHLTPIVCVVTPRWLDALESELGDGIDGTFADWSAGKC